MGDLSKNFSAAEFRCKCGKCKQIEPPQELVDALQQIRDAFGRPVLIHSGHRCRAYNKRVGGAARSQHLTAKAADFTIPGMENDTVQEYVLQAFKGKFGIGRYNNFTHLDVRPGPARWDFR